jgi:hypothetical protein
LLLQHHRLPIRACQFRPHVGTAPVTRLAGELAFDVGEPGIVGPCSCLDVMARAIPIQLRSLQSEPREPADRGCD